MKAYVVDSAAVRSNLQILKDRAGSAVLWAVLKGDGYGLGLVQRPRSAGSRRHALCRDGGFRGQPPGAQAGFRIVTF